MKKKQIVGLVIAAVLFIAVGVSSVLTNTFSQKILNETVSGALTEVQETDAPMEDYIGLIRVEGTIQEQTQTGMFEIPSGYQHMDTLNDIDRMMYDENNKGILLYVDSPGGTVYESVELYEKLQEYREYTGQPVWVYMAHYAASGGYMISMASDVIYANPNTTTGSIGVIMAGYDMTGLYEKLGIRYVSITSGENKDSSQFTDEQIALYQEQVDECYEDFVNKVAEGRGMSENEVKELADGRTYTAKQALKNGLIDEISLYDDMVMDMEDSLGVYQLYEPEYSYGMLASFFSRVESLVPKSEAQILTDTAAELESGVPMYYAEQLR